MAWRRKRVVAVAAVGLGLHIALAAWVAWVARPMPTTTEITQVGAQRHVVTRTRSHDLLPPSQWGVTGYKVIGCGTTSTVVTDSRKFLFFSVSDRRVSRYEPAGP